VAFRTAGGEVAVANVRVLRADRGVRIGAPETGLDVDSVEHLLAALGGLSIRRGLCIEVAGAEVPLADGAALIFAKALEELDLAREEPALAVLAEGEVRIEASSYAFEPADSVELEVAVEFDATAIGRQRATWDGAAASFLSEVAWARTFGFRREGEALRAAARARGVDPRAVMVLDGEGRVEAPGAPARPGEFARHKLLDLVGDLYLHGGPPLGRVRATRPGHAATHRAVEVAKERGLVGPLVRNAW
jgi:UDP-3-O-[3-hydroxymyristoyl] N-acetylglucosamine deacetylase